MIDTHKFHSFFTSGLHLVATCPLIRTNNGQILGFSTENILYIEEYDTDDLATRHILSLDGHILESLDETLSPSAEAAFPPLPPDLVRPGPVRAAMRLNFHGPRYRGLREYDRITDVVRPLEVPTRMELAARLALDIPPFALLGIAESQVLAEALLTPPHEYLVCRRIRIAYALPETQLDADQQPFDYDTFELYAAHRYAPTTDEFDLPAAVVLAGLPGVELKRPIDCMVHNQTLVVLEGGSADQTNRVHIWQVTASPSAQ